MHDDVPAILKSTIFRESFWEKKSCVYNRTFKFMLTYFKLFSVYHVRKKYSKIVTSDDQKNPTPNLQNQKAVFGGLVPETTKLWSRFFCCSNISESHENMNQTCWLTSIPTTLEGVCVCAVWFKYNSLTFGNEMSVPVWNKRTQ